MNNLVKTGIIFVIGMFTGQIMIMRDVEKGDIVVNNDDVYVKAAKGKSHGWSYARVNWKKPQ